MSNRDETEVQTKDMTPLERVSWLGAKIITFIVTGTRKAEEVADWLQVVISNPHFATLLRASRGATMDTEEPREGWLKKWEQFYFEVFGRTVDLSAVPVSAYQPGFGWVVYVLKGLSQNQIFAKMRDFFPCSSDYGDDLDRVITEEDRDPEKIGTYVRRFRNRVEADQELKEKSANNLREEKIETNTPREAMLLELFYYWRTGGGHLNLRFWNLCAGSRDYDGHIPRVRWGNVRFHVSNDAPFDSYQYDLRARAAV